MKTMQFIKDMGIETDFELSIINKEDTVTTTVHGNGLLIQAALMTLVGEVAKQEEITVGDKLEKMLAINAIREEEYDCEQDDDACERAGCGGDCYNCHRTQEMPEELRAIFGKVFGHKEDDK